MTLKRQNPDDNTPPPRPPPPPPRGRPPAPTDAYIDALTRHILSQRLVSDLVRGATTSTRPVNCPNCGAPAHPNRTTCAYCDGAL